MITVTSLTLLENMRAGGGERAWHEFFRRYGPFLLSFAKRLGLSDADANDAAQETLVAVHAAFREMSQPFDRTRGRFKSWLRAIAEHKVRDIQRRNQRAEKAVGRNPHTAATGAARPAAPAGGESAGSAADPAELNDLFELERRRNLVAQCLEAVAREVDPVAFQSFELYAIHGQSPGKVARLLGITRNSVYINKTRILRRIRAALAELRQEEDD